MMYIAERSHGRDDRAGAHYAENRGGSPDGLEFLERSSQAQHAFVIDLRSTKT